LTARLVPYRSLRQVEADATATAAAYTLILAAVRTLAHADGVIVNLAACAGILLVVTLLAEAVHIWRARRRGDELMPYDEMLKRFLAERAGVSLLGTVASMALSSSYAVMVMLLAVAEVSDWPILPIPVAFAAALGALCGIYTWQQARNYTRAAQKNPPLPSPMIQIAMRHYAGYAAGMAAALSAAAAFRDSNFAALVVLIAFAVGKLAFDAITPVVNYALPNLPRTIGQWIRAALFGVVWWGLPLGLLLALVADVFIPDVEPEALLLAVAAMSVASVIVTVFCLILFWIVGAHAASAQSKPAGVAF
jgi:hypothetical protein